MYTTLPVHWCITWTYGVAPSDHRFRRYRVGFPGLLEDIPQPLVPHSRGLAAKVKCAVRCLDMKKGYEKEEK